MSATYFKQFRHNLAELKSNNRAHFFSEFIPKNGETLGKVLPVNARHFPELISNNRETSTVLLPNNTDPFQNL